LKDTYVRTLTYSILAYTRILEPWIYLSTASKRGKNKHSICQSSEDATTTDGGRRMDQRWATRHRTSDFDECSARTQESPINVHDDYTHEQTPFTSDVQSSTTFDDGQTRHQSLPSSTDIFDFQHVLFTSCGAHVLTSLLTV